MAQAGGNVYIVRRWVDQGNGRVLHGALPHQPLAQGNVQIQQLALAKGVAAQHAQAVVVFFVHIQHAMAHLNQRSQLAEGGLCNGGEAVGGLQRLRDLGTVRLEPRLLLQLQRTLLQHPHRPRHGTDFVAVVLKRHRLIQLSIGQLGHDGLQAVKRPLNTAVGQPTNGQSAQQGQAQQPQGQVEHRRTAGNQFVKGGFGGGLQLLRQRVHLPMRQLAGHAKAGRGDVGTRLGIVTLAQQSLCVVGVYLENGHALFKGRQGCAALRADAAAHSIQRNFELFFGMGHRLQCRIPTGTGLNQRGLLQLQMNGQKVVVYVLDGSHRTQVLLVQDRHAHMGSALRQHVDPTNDQGEHQHQHQTGRQLGRQRLPFKPDKQAVHAPS